MSTETGTPVEAMREQPVAARAQPRAQPTSPLKEFEQVYLRNVDVLMGSFARRCRDPQTVADLTSETFVRAVAGTVRAEDADLGDGGASATVQMRRLGVAVLSASYDPGWTATVNGRREPVRMVAPALVAVDVPAGTDHVVFRYRGYGDYPEITCSR